MERSNVFRPHKSTVGRPDLENLFAGKFTLPDFIHAAAEPAAIGIQIMRRQNPGRVEAENFLETLFKPFRTIAENERGKIIKTKKA